MVQRLYYYDQSFMTLEKIHPEMAEVFFFNLSFFFFGRDSDVNDWL